jgi:molybdate transport system regulatory protein
LYSVTTDATGRGQAALLEDDAEFGERDAMLLRTIDRLGSVASAARELGRSRARALQRLETLENAFGPLVERTRGGSGGGGSQLTDAGRALLARYHRLAAALAAAATVPETVLEGTVVGRDGEIATVETAIGPIQTLHDGIDTGEEVQVRLGADSVTLYPPSDAPDPDSTSARNRVLGHVTDVDRGETVIEVALDAEGTRFRALVTQKSAAKLDLTPDRDILITWKATATRSISYPTASTDSSQTD